MRIFGYSSRSLLVPEALGGAAAVAVVYHLARKFSGEFAGVLAGLALAVTPMAAAMFRFNDPDALMTLLIVLAAWAVWVAVERASIKHLVAGGVLLGFAFLAKELEAFVVLPGLALVWVMCAPTTWPRRLWGWLWSGVDLLLSAGWWVAAVELWPADDRPYIASTSNNSLLSLIFGYNGLSRLFGSHGHGTGGATGFGGGAGWERFFQTTLGSQISWLVPLAALGLVAGLILAGRAPFSDRRRAGFILFGGWGVVGFTVFSKSSGAFHPYYTVAIAPAIAVLAGAGAVAMWDLGRVRKITAWMLPAGVAGSAVWAYVLLDRNPGDYPWLRVAVVVAGLVSAIGLLAARLVLSSALRLTGRSLRRSIVTVMVGLAAAALLAGPLAWSLSTDTHGSNGTNPTAGPVSAETTGFGGFGGSGRHAFGGGSGQGADNRKYEDRVDDDLGGIRRCRLHWVT